MNTDLEQTKSNKDSLDGITPTDAGVKHSARAGTNCHQTGSDDGQIISESRPRQLDDDALAFDLVENPQYWPDDPAAQAELAELLEIHLALSAHTEDLAPTLTQSKGIKRIARWMIPAAAVALAVLPASQVVGKMRETKRMQARGAVLQIELQKRIQIELWSDFVQDSLGLLKQVQTPAKYCDPSHEDRSGEVELARRLYVIGRSLPSDGLDDPEALDAKSKLQNWLTEVSANDACITLERSHELLALAVEMDLEGKADKLNRRLREVYS